MHLCVGRWAPLAGWLLLGSCFSDGGGLESEECLPSPAPACDQPCQHACGCSAPTEACVGDHLVAPHGNCVAVRQVCRPGACIDDPNRLGDARCAANCQDVKLAYARARSEAGIYAAVSGHEPLGPGPYNGSSSCEPADCVVTPGHCNAGLDTCWYLGPPIEKLERLAELYIELDCPADLTCDCPAPPNNVTCEMSQEGFEVWGRFGKFSHACVVR